MWAPRPRKREVRNFKTSTVWEQVPLELLPRAQIGTGSRVLAGADLVAAGASTDSTGVFQHWLSRPPIHMVLPRPGPPCKGGNLHMVYEHKTTGTEYDVAQLRENGEGVLQQRK
eukprot:1880665-Karenia_brevis.AAC.1